MFACEQPSASAKIVVKKFIFRMHVLVQVSLMSSILFSQERFFSCESNESLSKILQFVDYSLSYLNAKNYTVVDCSLSVDLPQEGPLVYSVKGGGTITNPPNFSEQVLQIPKKYRTKRFPRARISSKRENIFCRAGRKEKISSN